MTAARHHVALGALAYQRCSYRTATEHYQRSIAFLMRREDALSRYGAHQGSQDDDHKNAAKKLGVEIEKMEFYTLVLCRNNSSDMDFLQNKQHEGKGSHKSLLFKYDLLIGKNDTDKRPLPPCRLTFYLDQHGSSYALDSFMDAHHVMPPSSSSSSSSVTSSSQSHQTQILHLLKAYVMYNLALCHVALGSYAESLNLLRMVLDDDSPHPNGQRGGIPIDLVKVISEYQEFVQQVLQVQQQAATSSSNAAAASPDTNTEDEVGAESMDVDDAPDVQDEDINHKNAATTDEDGLPLLASAA